MALTAGDFTWDEYFWTANVRLPTWSAFQDRAGAYGSLDSAAPSEGLVRLVFAPEGREEGPLRDKEVDLVNRALALQEPMQRSMLVELLAQYPSLQKKYERFLGDRFGRLMPDVTAVEDFRRLIGLHTVDVHNIRGREPYVGLQLGCTWDEEHGLGVLMHGARVVEIGGADTAILLWIAKRDAKKRRWWSWS